MIYIKMRLIGVSMVRLIECDHGETYILYIYLNVVDALILVCIVAQI